MAIMMFVARQKNEYLKLASVLWVNLILLIAIVLSMASAYFGFQKGIPVTGLLLSTWLLLGGIFYRSIHHPYETLHHRLKTPIAVVCLAALISAISLHKLGIAI